MKSTLFSKSSIKKMTLSLVLTTVFLGVAGFSRAQNVFEQGGQVVAQTEPATNTKALTQISDISTLWALTKLGGGIAIAIFVVFGFGIFLIVLQVCELFMDKIRGRRLLATDYRKLVKL